MKTVLILTYYWPPAGGPGVQRVLKFAKYLPFFGWRPIVLTVKNGEYPALDETLLLDVPADLSVYKTASLEPFALYRKLTGKRSDDRIATFVLTEESSNLGHRFATFVRGNLFIPDARIGWKPFAQKTANRLVREHDIDLIFSTAPPMSTHLIGKSVAKQTARPWVADFRDPWTDVFYYHSLKRGKLAVAFDKRLEVSVLKSANAVVTVSPTLAELFEAKASNHCHVIPNGYDEEDFRSIPPLPDDGKKHFVHAGHLAGNQNPTGLWTALQKLIQSPTLVKPLQLDFYGSIHANVRQSLEDFGLLDHCAFHGYIPHDELVAVMKRAALLYFVVPETSYAKGIPTSKLFDYMGAGRPILGIGPEDGDAAEFLKESQAGRVLNTPDEILNFLTTVLSDNSPYTSRQTDSFTRKHLTEKLANVFAQFA